MDLDVLVFANKRVARPPAATLCGLRTPPCRITLAPSTAEFLPDIMVLQVNGAHYRRSPRAYSKVQVQDGSAVWKLIL